MYERVSVFIHACDRLCVCSCVLSHVREFMCARVCADERIRSCFLMCVCSCVRAHVLMSLRVCACVRACVRVCVPACGRA